MNLTKNSETYVHLSTNINVVYYNSNKLGITQLMASGGVALIGITLVPLLSGLF